MLRVRIRQSQSKWIKPAQIALMAVLCVGSPAFAADSNTPVDGGNRPALPQKVQQFLRDADSALKTGNLDLAIIQLKNAVQMVPNEGIPRARLGLALVRQPGSAVAAERELRQALKDHAPKPLVLPGILQSMLLRGESKELLDEFPEPVDVSTDPTAPDVLRARAIAQDSLGQRSEAVASIGKALQLRRDEPALLTGVRLAIEQKDLPRAGQLSQEALKMAPSDRDAMRVAINIMRIRGELQQALSATDGFVKNDPGNITARILRVQVLLDMNKDRQARQDVAVVLKQSSGSLIGRFYDAVLRARANDLQGAWREIQALPPNYLQSDAVTAITAAQIANASGNAEIGGAILTSFVSRNPNFSPARIQLAALRLGQKDPQAALDIIAPLKASNDPQVEVIQSQAYLQLHQYSQALSTLENASQSSPFASNELLKRELAFTQLQLGETSEAIQQLRELALIDPGNANIAWQLAMTLTADGKPDEALAAINRVAKQQPRNPLPAFYRGLILSSTGNLDGASAAFGQALSLDSKFTPALFYRANISSARGNPDQARKDLDQIVAQDPTNVLAEIGLAEMALNDDRDAEVVSHLDKAMSVDSKDPRPRLALARFQLLRRKYPQALATVDALLQIVPSDPEVMALRGEIQLASGAQKDAISTFRALANSYPKLPAAQIFLANALNVAKDPAGAEATVKKAIQLSPGSNQLRSILINLQFGGGKTQDAVDSARAFASAYPGPAADVLLAQTLYRAKQADEAKTVLAKSIAKKPNPVLVLALSQISIYSGDKNNAVGLLADWVKKHPGEFDMRLQYASMLLRTGDRTGARAQFELLLKQRPEDPIVLNNLGWILQNDDPVRGSSMVSLAAKIAPRSPEVVDTLGWIKFRQNDVKDSLPLLQRAHNLNSQDPEIGYHLALALNANGQRTEAKTLLKSVLSMRADFDDRQSAEQLVMRW